MSVDIAVCPNGDQCIDLGPGTHVINANVSLGMGSGPDDNLSNNVSNNSFTVSGGSDVTLTLLTDSYPGETTWSVTDANGLVIWSGGPYFSSETVYTGAACISYGCYTLSVFDSFGDKESREVLEKSLKLLLDIGESEAICLAKIKQMPLIIDEKKGRKIALNLNLKIIGLLGIIYLNVKKEFITKQEAKQLFSQAISNGYRISQTLISSMFDRLS
jgi:hypothetical protein